MTTFQESECTERFCNQCQGKATSLSTFSVLKDDLIACLHNLLDSQNKVSEAARKSVTLLYAFLALAAKIRTTIFSKALGSLPFGKASLGIGFWRNYEKLGTQSSLQPRPRLVGTCEYKRTLTSQSGSQPSSTLHSRSLSCETSPRTISQCSLYTHLPQYFTPASLVPGHGLRNNSGQNQLQ